MTFKNKKIESTLNNLFSSGRKTRATEVSPPDEAPKIPDAPTGVVSSMPGAGIAQEEVAGPEPVSMPAPVLEREPVAEIEIVLPKEPEPALSITPTPSAPLEESAPVSEPSAPAPEKSASLQTAVPVQTPAENIVHENQETQKIVVFTLADEYYGIDINIVESIIKMQTITEVPHSYPYVEGVTNLRGTVLPVIDLRRRFDLPKSQAGKDHRIVVVAVKEEKVGMIVDAVNEVITISMANVEPLPTMVSTLETSYVLGVAKIDQRLITLLDLGQILGL